MITITGHGFEVLVSPGGNLPTSEREVTVYQKSLRWTHEGREHVARWVHRSSGDGLATSAGTAIDTVDLDGQWEAKVVDRFWVTTQR